MLAFVSMFATSCQKENLVCPQHVGAEYVQPITDYHISYWVDGVHHSITLHSEESVSDFFHELTHLAVLGHHIRISKDSLPSENPSKDVVRFSTQSEKEFNEWIIIMEKDGYEIDYYYDKETGYFHGIASKK